MRETLEGHGARYAADAQAAGKLVAHGDSKPPADVPPAELAAAIARDTRALVKKQRTWFRTQLPPHRVLDAAKLQDPAELFP